MSVARNGGTTTGGGRGREGGAELMRCDLHVHTWYSGRAEVPVLEHVGRESYSHPLDVHDRARRRGMDLVTLTDNDTIEGALSLAHLPGTFVSEEAMPEGHNERARIVGRETGMAPVGGSEAHSVAHVAREFTTLPGARSKGSSWRG
jgi:hypothetical protein